MPRHLLFATVLTLATITTVSAGPISTYAENQERSALGAQENCQSQPEAPSMLGSIIGNSQKKALDNYYACLERNKRRDYLGEKSKMQSIVDQAKDSCHNEIRKQSSAPATLSFDNQKNFEFITGLNGSGIDTTDGGYSIKVSGSDIRGSFHVMCYMNKSFRITNVK